MTITSDASTPEDAPVAVAWFFSPHDAEMARVALASEGIASVVLYSHCQYTTALPWVRLDVTRHDHDRAATLLERGPTHATEIADESDDMCPLRRERRLAIGRWFLYRLALNCVMFFILMPLAVVPLGLARWSKESARRAFCLAAILHLPVIVASIAASGPTGSVALIPQLAFYFAWMSAVPGTAEYVAESFLPRTPTISIGDSWKAGAEGREPPEHEIWIFRPIGVFLLLVVVVWVVGRLVVGG
jgi:hypothetical protein